MTIFTSQSIVFLFLCGLDAYLRVVSEKSKGESFLHTQVTAIEQYFHVVLFIMLYQVVLTLKSVDEIVAYDHSNESYWAVFSCGTVLYAIRGELAICGRNPSYDHFNCTLLSYVSY